MRPQKTLGHKTHRYYRTGDQKGEKDGQKHHEQRHEQSPQGKSVES